MTITITTHKQYECEGGKFTTFDNEILAIADYWDDANKEVSKKLLYGFGFNTFDKYSTSAKKEIIKTMTAEYGEKVASTGVTLLGIPKLVMRFKIQ